jgi:predicted nucleotidyltransferase
MNRKDFISKIREAIQKPEPGAEIYLFGSRARGDFNSESDWDILIVSPQKKITFDNEIKLREPLF